MLRLQERRGVVAEHEHQLGDPWVIDDWLETVLECYGTFWDTCWWEEVSINGPTPEEAIAGRERQIIQLARHGRQSIDAVERWTVAKIQRWHRRLREQIDAESTFDRIGEL